MNKQHAGKDYLSHGNNVFSMLIQKPEHVECKMFAIEQVYPLHDMIKKDEFGRRLYMSSEFDKHSIHNKNKDICYNDKKPAQDKILDSGVMLRRSDGTEYNIALTKNDFAIAIAKATPPFNSIDYSGFMPTFERIKKIYQKECA